MEQVRGENFNISDKNFNANYVDRKDRESWKSMAEGLYADVSRLISREGELIRTEVKEKLVEVKGAMVSMAVGGAFLMVGLFAFVATAIIWMAKYMDLGIAAGIVTFALLVVGAIAFFAGKKKLTADHLVPNQSIDTLGQIKSTFKERINEYKSISHH